MGHKSDQGFPSTTQQLPLSSVANTSVPPPLPPRGEPALVHSESPSPPPYTETAEIHHSQPLSQTWTEQDPRSSSTQSLVPEQDTAGSGKRTLLLIWVHGFMGNETSFQSFPAHVHNNVTAKMEAAGSRATHQVHTKIYPRYKSKNKVEQARDSFIDWLVPHEAPETDVILLGHSMGGLLSAEVVLKTINTNDKIKTFRHRIMGTINFDTPFLGMHPGVIASGLGSLFRPGPDTPGVESASKPTIAQEPTPDSTVAEGRQGSTASTHSNDILTDSTSFTPTISGTSGSSEPSLTPLNPSRVDPNYDPPFSNDVRLPKRTGWSNAWHFINKHSDGLVSATKSYVTSHLEFGGCLADYKGLQTRYSNLRALEDVDSSKSPNVRFVNYYTASTGRPKKVKPLSPQMTKVPLEVADAGPANRNAGYRNISGDVHSSQSLPLERKSSIGKTKDGNAAGRFSQSANLQLQNLSDESDDVQAVSLDASPTMSHVEPALFTENEAVETAPTIIQDELDRAQTSKHSVGSETDSDEHMREGSVLNASLPPSLSPVPAIPSKPPPFDPIRFSDKDTRKLAEKEHARQMKTYQRMVKDRDRVIKDRRKYLEKREKNASKERGKQVQREEKERLKDMALEAERETGGELKGKETSQNQESSKGRETVSRLAAEHDTTDDKSKPEKSKRDRKFCMLPPTVNGLLDPCWIRVFMPGRDEVGAHCGLFVVDGDRYEWFVGDVAERIESWVVAAGREMNFAATANSV